jgi:hypothetical protein
MIKIINDEFLMISLNLKWYLHYFVTCRDPKECCWLTDFFSFSILAKILNEYFIKGGDINLVMEIS